MDINLMDYLQPVVVVVLTSLAGILAKVIYTLLKRTETWIISKINFTTYENAKEIAYGIYILLEDKYGDNLVKMGDIKKREMEEILLTKFPTLTQTELDSINKEVWLAFNESWNEEVSRNRLDG